MAVLHNRNLPMHLYRKDLFEDQRGLVSVHSDMKGYELAVPANWDQLVESRIFSIGRPTFTAGSSTGSRGLQFTITITCCLETAANCQTPKDSTLLLNSPEFVKALTIIQKLSKVSPPGYQTQSFFDADKLMQGGKLAAYWNWSNIWAALSKSPDKYAMASTPGPGIVAGGFWWAVPEKAPHPECAKKFISWMLNDDFQTKQMLATGNPAATTSVQKQQRCDGQDFCHSTPT